MKNCKNDKKGITLVALIVTIIILLILSGIAISQLTDNGLFENVKLAKEIYQNAQSLENDMLSSYEEYINGHRDEETSSNEELIAENENLKSQINILTAQINTMNTEKNNLNSELERADATASDILSGKKAYTSSGLVNGSITNRGTLNWNPTTLTTQSIEAGYYTGGTLDSRGVTTKGTEWNSGTKTSTADSLNTIDVDFVPSSIIIFNTAGVTKRKLIYDTHWGNNVSASCGTDGIKTYNFGDEYTATDTFIISVGTSVVFHAAAANTWYWYAIK